MALRTIITPEKKRKKIMQCFICRHWEEVDSSEIE